MTGTASTEAGEFAHTYAFEVVSIPTNQPMVRADHADLIYKSEQAKFEAVADDIQERHDAGQPVLVGTISVEKSEVLSRVLERRGVPHSVLNAKQHEREAHDRHPGRTAWPVTVATNMAGRGVDILLGGNPEGLARQDLLADGTSPEETPDRYAELVERHAAECSADGRRGPRRSAASTSSGPSGTRADESTTSCEAGPVARATRGRAASTSPSKTTSCGSSPPAR